MVGGGLDVLLDRLRAGIQTGEIERETHEDEMIVISNPIGALPAEPAKQTGPDVV